MRIILAQNAVAEFQTLPQKPVDCLNADLINASQPLMSR
jgi:hypothetical protein